MTDTKPTQEHLDRANACRSLLTRDSFGLVADDDVQALANQFADVDAIARRRALEEAAAICDEVSSELNRPPEQAKGGRLSANECRRRILLLRTPPDEKAEER